MARSLQLVCFVMAAVSGVLLPALGHAQNPAPLAGLWTLNRSLSEFPREMGFDVDWIAKPSGGGQSAGSNVGGRGRRGSAGGGTRASAGPSPSYGESYEDARGVQLL